MSTGAEDEKAVRRTVAREFRPRRSVPAVIVAALIAITSILIVIEVISRLFGEPIGVLPADDLARLGRETAWSDPLAVTVAVVAVLLGLLLLALALAPGRVRARALAPVRPGLVVAMPTADLQRLAVQAAESVDGVDRATVRAGNGRLTVRADSSLHEVGGLPDEVRQAVDEKLARLDLLRPPQVAVDLRHRRD
jgi:hypothetical protein